MIVATVQMVSDDRLERNLERAEQLVCQAVEGGAQFVVLPENFAVFGANAQLRVGELESTDRGPLRRFLSGLAKQYGIWLLGGTIPICDHPDDSRPYRPYSASLLIDDKGHELARYNKVHLFDVCVNDQQGRYAESDIYRAGNAVVVQETPFGRLGIAVCYDLRFPELFRLMFQQGVDIIALPAAFTQVTGQAHWMPLLRARAIENSCYVIAANQGGFHSSQRQTYGHSCVISGWGEVLTEIVQGEGVALADYQLDALQEQRRQIPTGLHQRFFVKNLESG